MQDYRHDPFMPGDRPTNPVGLVGFILAFCVSPVGFLLSIIGLFFRPRGFAIAGAIIGAFGTALWAVVIGVVYAAVQMVLPLAEISNDMTQIRDQIASYRASNNGEFPQSLSDLSLSEDALKDTWGQPYSYSITHDGENFKVVSAGADKKFDTSDDLVMDRYLAPEAMSLMQGADIASLFFREADIPGYSATLRQFARAEAAMNEYRKEHGEFPASPCDIVGLCDGSELTDGWGRPFRYTLSESGRSYELISDGKDGVPDSEDDMNSNNIEFDFNNEWIEIERTP